MEKCISKEHFYDVNELINKINENEFGKTFTEIYDYFKNAQITVTERDIKSFLAEKIKEDHADINDVEKPDEFMKAIGNGKYAYNECDLKYFKRYVEIIREKSLTFCLIVISILNKRPIDEIEVVLPDFKNAINMRNGKIDSDSIQRLSRVVVNNYKIMKEKIDMANTLNTYLTNIINLPELYADGFLPSDLFPSNELQNFIIPYCDSSSLELSPKQFKKALADAMEKFRFFLNMSMSDGFASDTHDSLNSKGRSK